MSFAGDWKYAYPRFAYLLGDEHNGFEFRQSYVKYHILKDDTGKDILEIDLHDFIDRNGYMYKRLLNQYVYFMPCDYILDVSTLQIMLGLISGVIIHGDQDDMCEGWKWKPNFDLYYNLICDLPQEKIIAAFKRNFPKVDMIIFSLGKDNKIETAVFEGDTESWCQGFKQAGVQLNLAYQNCEVWYHRKIPARQY